MDDAKRQESKKTVVAFVIGLLIGGLLVWLFSGSLGSSKKETALNESGSIDAAIEQGLNEVSRDEEASSTGAKTATDKHDFSFSINDQPAGMTVSLGNVKYPTDEGWIAVHEEIGGELGNVLGASRYDTNVGLLPKTVELLRSTIKGKTYHVVYYSESGDRMFDRKEDKPLTKEGGGLIEATFVAK
jgi:hypothetical protein